MTNQSKKKLKTLASAYDLAEEYDYVPEKDQFEEAKEICGDFDNEEMLEYIGLRHDEVINALIREIKKL